jgi:Tfp pilus assembly protein PilX
MDGNEADMLSGENKLFLQAPPRQHGTVLLIALIMLVALTLGGIALVRSVYTSNIVAGNLAFQQAATNAADVGIASATTWLQTNNVCAETCTLTDDLTSVGYFAKLPPDDPNSPKAWDALWTTLVGQDKVKTMSGSVGGNSVSYVIHRMCNGIGAYEDANCSQSPSIFNVAGANDQSNPDQVLAPSRVYYRITVRVAGPRNTVSYVQSIVSM